MSTVLHSRFVEQQFDWTNKGHLKVTPFRIMLDNYSRNIRKGGAIKDLILI